MSKNKKVNIMDIISKHKKEIAFGAILLVAVIVCIVFLLLNNGDNSNNENGNTVDNTEVENVVITEEEIVNTYGLTKEDAINLVKQNINSDNFEYSVEINNKARYVVTVKNTLTNTEYKYEVDPMTKEYYEI
ncbi:MAG: hypothetical protein J6A52_05630 [Bacilli bacterium]|nr:hypothetical protein [Bacilli bacterium]